MSATARIPNHLSPAPRHSAPRTPGRRAVRRSLRVTFGTLMVTGVAFLTLAAVGTQSAMAATATVNLGTSSAYAVLAGSAITNTGATTVGGDIGISPGTSVTGFPPGLQTSGTTNVANGAALDAENDLITASNDAAGRTPFTTVSGDLGGTTLVAGVYRSTSSMGLTGTVTLNGGGNLDSVFIFQAGSTLTTASSSTIALENGAQACNVFWQVGSSATLGTTTNFVGTILATTSITLNTGATVNGRVLALGGAVTMDDNTINVPTCSLATTTTTTAGGTTSTTTAGGTTSTTTAGGTTSTTTAGTTTTTSSTGVTTTVAGLTASAATTSSTFPIPLGAPETGAGGAAKSDASLYFPIGLLALGMASVAGVTILRARRAK